MSACSRVSMGCAYLLPIGGRFNHQQPSYEISFFMKYIYIINDFAHDLFTGLWLSSLAAIYLIRLKTGGADGSELQLVSELSGDFLWMQNIALGLIMLTGLGRYLHQKKAAADNHVSHHQARRRVLIIKHIVMGILFTLGTALGLVWRLHLGP